MRTFLGLFRRPSWVAFTVFVAFASVGFYELGVWQLHRHTHQSRIDHQLSRSKSMPPVPATSLLSVAKAPPSAVQWRRVTATGTYDAAHQLLVRNRVMLNANGYEVLVPLRTTDGVDLVVDRGWIPSGPTAEGPAKVPPVPTGTVSIVGRIRPPEGARSNAGLPPGQTQRIVPAQVATQTARPTYGGFVDLVQETPTPADSPAILLSPDQQDSGGWWKPPHLAYAIQWFLFIGIALGGWVILARRELTLDTATSADVGGDQIRQER
jgi:cytochrome oxidase assembly protein ShyY1